MTADKPEEIKEEPKEEPKTTTNDQTIVLSDLTNKLITAYKEIKQKAPADDYTKLTVSQTVSFLALVYEKVRNALEYREDHLIRRAAIERILKRRLALNPAGKNEAENVLRELMWARYFPNGSLGQTDIHNVQKIIDKYLKLRQTLLVGRNSETKQHVAQFLLDLFTAELEEFLNPADSKIESNFTYYIFQTLREKVKIDEADEKQKDTFLFVAIEKAYRKSDTAFQRYHLFRLFYKEISDYASDTEDEMVTKLPSIFKKIDELIANPTVEKLIRFTRKQLPPYLILFSVIKQNKGSVDTVLANKNTLWSKVDQTAREKYAQIRSRLNILAFRSLIYIFITKMALALVIEVPLSKLIYNEISYIAIGINSLFPPLMMLVIILSVSIPGDDNTKRLYFRIMDIINADPTFEKTVALITKKARYRRPLLVAGFTILYSLTFLVTLYLIHRGLRLIHFNLLSEALFIFFVSVVAFFAHRIKQLANMYRLEEKGSVFSPLYDFFFMPILSLGKIFNEGVARINFFIVLFDFIIEAPFKLIIEVIEEWITFVRNKKEEIV
jgi:hypothetical protein